MQNTPEYFPNVSPGANVDFTRMPRNRVFDEHIMRFNQSGKVKLSADAERQDWIFH